MRKLIVTLMGLGLVLSAIVGNAWCDDQYTVTDLGTLDGPNAGWSEALGLNNTGQIVGASSIGPDVHAFLFSGGKISDLGVLTSNNHWSEGAAINDLGVAIGMSTTYKTAGYAQDSRAVSFSAGTVSYLGSFGGDTGIALGINNAGQVVGNSDYSNGVGHAFLWSSGVMEDIDNLPGEGNNFSYAYDINNHGQVVGNIDKIGLFDQAFLWKEGEGMNVLGGLPGLPQSRAYKINDLSQVVGESFVHTAPGEYSSGHAFLWQNGVMTDLGMLASTDYSLARSINNLGTVVGDSYTDPGDKSTYRAFLWDGIGGIRDLNTMLDTSGTGWTLLHASDINDMGLIVGFGYHSGELRAFLLTPIPEPSTLVLLGMGAFSLLAFAWRRLKQLA